MKIAPRSKRPCLLSNGITVGNSVLFGGALGGELGIECFMCNIE
jgi:hypothetical protein